MKTIIKAISFGALLVAGNLAFAGEPVVLGANDLDQVNAGFAWSFTSGALAGASVTGNGAASATSLTNSSAGFFQPVSTSSTGSASAWTTSGTVTAGTQGYASFGNVMLP